MESQIIFLNPGSYDDYLRLTEQMESFLIENKIPYDTEDGLLIGSKNLKVKKINLYDFLHQNRNVIVHNGYEKRTAESMLGPSPVCKFIKMTENAVIPSKKRWSDSGYDITLIGLDKVISSVTKRYKTGIRIECPLSYYVDMVPRSSLSSSGYILTNSVGIIDMGYTGELLVTLTKIDPDAKEIEFPFKCMQIILRKAIHFEMKEVDTFDSVTLRGDGGFGSTGK